MKFKRRRFLVDRSVQLGLVGRLILHWLLFFATVVVGLPVFRAILLGDIATPLSLRLHEATVDAGVLLLFFALLLPYFIYDSLKTTNRFSGPVYRLRRTMRAVADGAPFQPIRLRKGDYWQDMADEFNRLVVRLQTTSASAASETAEEHEEHAVAS